MADSNNATIINVNDAVNVRSEPTTASSLVTTLALGSRLKVNSSVSHKSNDTSGYSTWYSVTFTKNGTTYNGYIANHFVKCDPIAPGTLDAEFENSIAGFPESYKASLRSLHVAHPNWKFVAQNASASWSSALALETKSGVSLIEDTTNKSWQDGSEVIDSPNWVNASEGIVAYYMDPRNSLTENAIFQFLNVKSTSHSAGQIELLLDGTFMDQDRSTPMDCDKSDTEYHDLFEKAQEKSGIDGIFLAARVLQECGNNGSSSSNGGTVGGRKVFNFFNIGAYSDATNAAYRGLNFARYGNGVNGSSFNTTYEIPWTSQGDAIVYGAIWINDYYANKGQNTIYYMRFNMSPNSSYSAGSHQYYTAIQSPTMEATKMYNAYQKAGLLDSSLTFTIPVYSNMPTNSVGLPDDNTVYYEFMHHVYQKILRRDCSNAEAAPFVEGLKNGGNPISTIMFFFNSAEYKSKNYSSEQKIKDAYSAMLNRGATSSDVAHCMNSINYGYSIHSIYQMVSSSVECKNFISSCGLSHYSPYTDTDLVDNHMNMRNIVIPMYEVFLGRSYDVQGLRNWISQLASKTMSGQQVAAAFFNSREYGNLNISIEDYVTSLYHFLGREPDGPGFTYWCGFLKRHYTREYVFHGFVNSAEFNNKCKQYGATTSVYQYPKAIEYHPNGPRIGEFVNLTYSTLLGRNADAAGKNNWTCYLGANGNSAAGFVNAMVTGAEYRNKNLSDEETVRRLFIILYGVDPVSSITLSEPEPLAAPEPLLLTSDSALAADAATAAVPVTSVASVFDTVSPDGSIYGTTEASDGVYITDDAYAYETVNSFDDNVLIPEETFIVEDETFASDETFVTDETITDETEGDYDESFLPEESFADDVIEPDSTEATDVTEDVAGADEDTIIEETEVLQESAEGDTDALKAFGGSRIGLGIGFSYDIYNIKPEYLSEFNYCLQLYRQSPRDAINYMADSSTFIDTCYYLGIANK